MRASHPGIVIAAVLALAACGTRPSAPAALPTADAVRAHTDRHLIAAWFPACLDPATGGFHPAFAEDWSRKPAETRSIVFTSRMVWTAAAIARHRPERAAEFRAIADRGAEFLFDRYWDAEHGGMHWEIDPAGKPVPGEKHLYGMAFALYALCAAGGDGGRPLHLERASRLLAWMDAHAHDGANGGWFEALDTAGKPLPPSDDPEARSRIGYPYGVKSMNAHIHLLEALTEMVRRIPADALARARFTEMFALVRDRVCTPMGMNQFFTADWRALPDLDSFGHDLETAYLLEEASQLIDGDHARTWAVQRALVDHALAWGRNADGTFADAGPAFNPATKPDGIWWSQAEAINGLILMDRRHGAETPRYRQALADVWRAIDESFIDHRHGGWYWYHAAARPDTDKGNNWMAAYHTGRALFNLEEHLAQPKR